VAIQAAIKAAIGAAQTYCARSSTFIFCKADINVPFMIYLKSVATGVQVETHGTYRGVTTWNLHHTLTTGKPGNA
jgi:hypothetical protein